LNLMNSLAVALNGLRMNKLRSALTMLGIIIGVAAVIVMIAIGQGASKQISDQIGSMGSNLLMVSPAFGQGPVRGAGGNVNTLNSEDAKAIANLNMVEYVSPELGGGATVEYTNQTWTTQFTGTWPQEQDIKSWRMGVGSFFTNEDVQGATMVAVIGQTVADNLFSAGVNPVGATIRINKLPFTVVGVLGAKGASSMGQDQDDVIYIPLSTAQRRLLGENNVRMINVQTQSPDSMAYVQSNIEALLRERHRLAANADDDFQIRNLTSVLETVQSTTGTMTLLLASIAAISLLVGGIGTMNIMLVSVIERTREIGLRMAVGATGGNIRTQFLIEALVLCLFGGLAGIIIGIGGAYVITHFYKWPVAVSLSAVLLAVGFSAAIGIFFGYYPANKAAKLDPIEALRFE